MLSYIMKNRVTLIMKSGAKFTIYCKSWKISSVGSDLTKYSFEGITGEVPSYIRIEDVDVVLTKQIFRWFK